MNNEILSIVVLVVIFGIASVLPINMGALAFAAAFVVGSVILEMTPATIFSGFPSGLFLTLVGVTYLFVIAQNNGTIDWLIERWAKAARPSPKSALSQAWRRNSAICSMACTGIGCRSSRMRSCSLTAVNIGLPYTTSGLLRFFHNLPIHVLKELFFTANKLDVQRAERFGLVNRLVDSDMLEATALELARMLRNTRSSGLP